MSEAERIARELALELAGHPGVLAVAATGSLARGDLGPGSDLDLWVLGPEDGRDDLVVDELEVTLLYTSLDYARSLDFAARFEAREALALHDPAGALAAVVDAIDDDAVRAEIARDYSAWLRELGSRAPSTPTMRAARAREIALRCAGWFAWSARGWRVPKQRHLDEVLFPGERAALARVARVDAVDLAALPAAVEAARAPSPGWALPSRARLARYLDAGRAFDAVVAVREALPPLPDGARPDDAATRALFELVHPPLRPGDEDALRALAARCGIARLPGGRACLAALEAEA